MGLVRRLLLDAHSWSARSWARAGRLLRKGAGIFVMSSTSPTARIEIIISLSSELGRVYTSLKGFKKLTMLLAQPSHQRRLTYLCCCCSVVQACPILRGPLDCSTPGLPVHHQLPEFAQTHVHRVGDVIQPSHPLSPPSPPAFNLSSIRVFSGESVLRIRWPNNRSFSFSTNPSNEYSGLISFRMDWLDRLAVQGTLKNLVQHHGGNQ